MDIKQTTDNAALLELFLTDGMKGKSENTVKAYRQSLKQFAEYLTEKASTDLRGYIRQDVQMYITYLEKVRKRSASGVNAVLAAIRAYSRYADKADTIEDIRIIKPVKAVNHAPESLERPDVLAIIRTTKLKTNQRDHAIVQLLVGCGLRVSELVALDRDDITMTERTGQLLVRDGKGGKQRMVAIRLDARNALNDYYAQRSDSNEAVFTAARGNRISVRTVQAMLARYGVNPHAFRHTFITALVNNGKSIATIMALSGHESAEMIARYSAPTKEELQNAVEELYI